MGELLIGKATFDQNRNDLSWTFWISCYNHLHCEKESTCKEEKLIRIYWSGYNDQYWWNMVSVAEQTTTRTLKCGRKIRVNFHTNEVFEIKE